tara:strand:- start:2568 stop:2798 length:231 start_codon:yes stop_codon:yes gene_type:complete
MTAFEKAPKSVEQEIKEYQRKRFEEYMEMADIGMLPRALAITALREEIEYSLSYTDDCATEAIDAESLRKILEDES